MSEASRAREASMGFEAKKDRLAQTQDGLWKVTFTVKAEDMPHGILNAAMGQRFMIAAVAIGDNEEPVPQDTPGMRAKKHFEAMCQDGDFQQWVDAKMQSINGPFGQSFRTSAKWIMGIQSANELIDNPEPWNRLWTEFQYRNVQQ